MEEELASLWEQSTQAQPQNEDLTAVWEQSTVSDAQPTGEQPQDSGFFDEVQRQVGLTIRAGVEGTAGAASVLTDPIAEIMNMALPEDQKIAMIKPAVSKMLTDAGVPEPETTTEKIVQTASQALVGAGGAIKTASKLGANALTDLGKGVSTSVVEKAGAQAGGAIGGGVGQKIAEESDGGTGMQIAGALVGGLSGYGAVNLAKVPASARQALTQEIKSNPTSAEAAPFKIVANKTIVDKTAQETIKQGFKPAVISAVKTGSNKDKFAMKKMLAIHKKGQGDAVYAANNRPTDVVGDSLNERVEFLFKANKNAGKAIDGAATKLKDKTVNIDQPLMELRATLDDMGVVIKNNKDGEMIVDITKSDIRLENTSRRIIENVLRSADESGGNAFNIHKLKRLIDTQVSYGKGKQSVGKNTEAALKKFRHNLNTSLGELSPAYKVANTKYSETIGVLDDIQKAVGTSIDMNSANVPKSFGTSLRGLLSNNKSRVKLMDAVTNAETISAKYGLKANDDITRQVIFANEIDRMFGATAQTSLKGQIEEATKSGLNAARRGLLDTAIDIGAKGVDKARGINEKNAIKSIEELLKQKY